MREGLVPWGVDPLFHITTQAAWAAASSVGSYHAESLASEGFIHLSTAAQWRASAARHFRGQRDLVLLRLAPDRLLARVEMEPAHGELFPHLYGAIALAAVVEVTSFSVDDGGEVAIG